METLQDFLLDGNNLSFTLIIYMIAILFLGFIILRQNAEKKKLRNEELNAIDKFFYGKKRLSPIPIKSEKYEKIVNKLSQKDDDYEVNTWMKQ